VVVGRVLGSWKRAVARDAVTVTLNLRADLGARRDYMVVEAAARYAAFVGRDLALEQRLVTRSG
jgi:hypothetical protein